MSTPTGPAGFVLRLLTADGGTAGVGVLVSQSQMLTCAHVVNAALGRAADSPGKPHARNVFEVCFPLLDDEPPKRYRARVEEWLPPRTEGTAGGDLARVLLIDLIPEVKAAVRDRDLPPTGRFVQVFGYPKTPNRPDGCWAEAEIVDLVGRERMRLDSLPDSAVRIQPGFSGSPVVDQETGLVLGLLATTSNPQYEARESYAITVEQIGSMWPGPAGPASITPVESPLSGRGVPEEARRVRDEGLVILHLSDPQFGRNHLFGRKGGTTADHEQSTLFLSLTEDLDRLAKDENLHPDLIVVTGDLTEWGMADEFEQVTDFLSRLAAELNLPRRRVVIIPGNHDVNRFACEEYFLHRTQHRDDPEPPYSPKWDEYTSAFDRLYQDVSPSVFNADQPWSSFDFPELELTIAGLNSTMAESHRDEDHYGEVGAAQLEWFRGAFAQPGRARWIRVAAVHHNVVHGATDDDENLRDAEALDRVLGAPGHIQLLLHGHTHDGRPHRLPSGLLALSTGSAAPTADTRATDMPNQYQVLVLKRGEIIRYARQYLVGEDRWTGDHRVTPTGHDWRDQVDWTFRDIGKVFQHPELVKAEAEHQATGTRSAAVHAGRPAHTPVPHPTHASPSPAHKHPAPPT